MGAKNFKFARQLVSPKRFSAPNFAFLTKNFLQEKNFTTTFRQFSDSPKLPSVCSCAYQKEGGLPVTHSTLYWFIYSIS